MNTMKRRRQQNSFEKDKSMEIRKTRMEELDKVMEIYAHARKFMVEHNNPNQWKNNKPSREQIEADILAGKHHICEEELCKPKGRPDCSGILLCT